MRHSLRRILRALPLCLAFVGFSAPASGAPSVLALLFLGICERDRFTGLARAWKAFDWAAMERLHQKGLIHNPVGKAKSVSFTEEGLEQAERLFLALCGRAEAPT
jgi:hypothetical protein